VGFKAGAEVSYGVHEQSEAPFHVPAQSIDEPLSTVTEGEDVRSQRPHRFRAVDSQAIDSGQHFGDGRSPPLVSVMSDPPIGLAGPFHECPR
jgi:hypothetical protein